MNCWRLTNSFKFSAGLYSVGGLPRLKPVRKYITLLRNTTSKGKKTREWEQFFTQQMTLILKSVTCLERLLQTKLITRNNVPGSGWLTTSAKKIPGGKNPVVGGKLKPQQQYFIIAAPQGHHSPSDHWVTLSYKQTIIKIWTVWGMKPEVYTAAECF